MLLRQDHNAHSMPRVLRPEHRARVGTEQGVQSIHAGVDWRRRRERPLRRVVKKELNPTNSRTSVSHAHTMHSMHTPCTHHLTWLYSYD